MSYRPQEVTRSESHNKLLSQKAKHPRNTAGRGVPQKAKHPRNTAGRGVPQKAKHPRNTAGRGVPQKAKHPRHFPTREHWCHSYEAPGADKRGVSQWVVCI